MKPTEQTGFYDRDGIPIHVGDLIRVEHYTHRRNRRKMYLYFRVAKKEDKFVVQNWNDLDETKHQCLLQDCGIAWSEVLAEATFCGITFNERKRINRGV
jgi:hypothetical protein